MSRARVALLLLLALPLSLLSAVSLGAPAVADSGTPPFGVMEEVASPAVGRVRITGWVADPDSPMTPVTLAVSMDNKFVPAPDGVGWKADVSRPELPIATQGYGDRHGYVIEFDATPGKRWVCTWAKNLPNTFDPSFNRCSYVRVQSAPPDTVISGSEVQGAAHAFLFHAVESPFTFNADDKEPRVPPVSTFQCQWDGGAWQACGSPAAAELAPGPHTFAVRAVNEWGAPDPTPAVRTVDVPYPYTPPITSKAIALGVKAVKKKGKLRVSVRPRSKTDDYVFQVQKKRKKKWKKVKRLRTKGPKDVKVINLRKGRYRVVIKNQHGLVGTTSQTVRLKR